MVSPSETAISENNTDHRGLQYASRDPGTRGKALSGPLCLAVGYSWRRRSVESLRITGRLRHHSDNDASVTLELAGADTGDDCQRCQRDRTAPRHLEQRRIVKNQIRAEFLPAGL